MVQIAATAAGGVIIAWPWLKSLFPAVLKPAKAGVSYEAAIHNLAVVRSRLSATGHLTDDQKKAIDVLTLALVAGSDT